MARARWTTGLSARGSEACPAVPLAVRMTSRNLLRSLKLVDPAPRLGVQGRAPFVQHKLRLNLRPGVLDQPGDSGRAGLLVGLREQDHVAAQRHVPQFEFHQHRQFGRQQRFVILRSASVDVAIAQRGRKRRDAPLRRVRRNHVAVRHQQQGPWRLGAMAPGRKTRHKIQSRRLLAQQLRGDPVGRGGLLQVFGRARFVSGRIAGVDPYQVCQITAGAVLQGRRRLRR